MYIVLPLALLFAGLAVWAFIWAVRHGQLDDLETPAARILLDDDGHPAPRPARRPVPHAGPQPAAPTVTDAPETRSHDAEEGS